MAKIMDPILTIPSILGYWSIILGSFGGPGRHPYLTLKKTGLNSPDHKTATLALHVASTWQFPSIGGPMQGSLQ